MMKRLIILFFLLVSTVFVSGDWVRPLTSDVGGNPFDQDLNTFDGVSFVNMSTSSIFINNVYKEGTSNLYYNLIQGQEGIGVMVDEEGQTNGTLFGEPDTTLDNAYINRSAEFTVNTQYVQVLHDIGNSEGSIMAWVYNRQDADGNAFVYTTSASPTSAASHSFGFDHSGVSGTVFWANLFQSFPSSSIDLFGNTTWVKDTWYHVGISWEDNNEVRLCVNGVQEDSNVLTTSYKGGDRFNMGGINFGGFDVPTGLVGLTDELAVYNKSFECNAEFRQVFNNGVNGNNITDNRQHFYKMDEVWQSLNSLNIFNTNKENIDFQIKGQNFNNVFYIDASSDKIGIGIDNPTELLHLDKGTGFGSLKIDGSNGACLMLRDTDDNGWTKCTSLNGVLSCAIDADGNC